SSSDVFMGLVNYYPGLTTPAMWNKFLASRSGDATKAQATGAAWPPVDMTINAAYPSRFMRPFRSAGGFWLTSPLADGSRSPSVNREIDATLMRSDPDPNWSGRPLWQVDDYSMSTQGVGATPDTFPNAAMDYNRSSNFRYQLLQKLAGTTTTQSNV